MSELKTSNPCDDVLPLSEDDRIAIAQLALGLGISGTPDKAAHNLWKVTLSSGKTVTAHVVHAVDAIITDGNDVVLINRMNPPGQGLPALPGGFIDPTNVGVENVVQAAVREALEETGIKLEQGTPMGSRNMYRPFDVRTANKDLPQYGITKGDIFMVSTQAVRFDVKDLSQTKLVAGDDAQPGSARRVLIASLTRDKMGIQDHYDMIVEALTELQKGCEQSRKIESGHNLNEFSLP